MGAESWHQGGHLNAGCRPSVVEGMSAVPHDEELLDALYAEYAGPLLEYVQRLVGGDRHQAEDIVQETLLRAWRHAGELSSEDARPWLFTVARRLVVDGYRRRSVRPRAVAAESVIVAMPAPDELERALLAWEVGEALRTLSAEHRRVLLEVHYRDRPVAEAAAVLGIPEGTVRSRTFYALRALRLALEERGGMPS
jgi:RNA polymerase sigma-70 factor (ECF subfamily)